jgi:hypothetical protein
MYNVKQKASEQGKQSRQMKNSSRRKGRRINDNYQQLS